MSRCAESEKFSYAMSASAALAVRSFRFLQSLPCRGEAQSDHHWGTASDDKMLGLAKNRRKSAQLGAKHAARQPVIGLGASG